jgi:hypothetical protein
LGLQKMPRFNIQTIASLFVLCLSASAVAETSLTGRVVDPQDKIVVGASIKLVIASGSLIGDTNTDASGTYVFGNLKAGSYQVTASAPGFAPVDTVVSVTDNHAATANLQFEKLQSLSQSIVITARVEEPSVDLRNSEVFSRTLFTRDD